MPALLAQMELGRFESTSEGVVEGLIPELSLSGFTAFSTT